MKENTYRQKYRKLNPWFSHYNCARSRCVYPYGKYFGKVKFLMTLEDFKKLWFRDNAWLLENPSIDRINNKGDYTLNNCRFIEFNENRKRYKKILQIDLMGKIVKEWNSIANAVRGTHFTGIYYALAKKYNTSGGYIWKYANQCLT